MLTEKQKEIKNEIKEFMSNNFNAALLIAACVTLLLPLIIGFGGPVVCILWIILLIRFKYFRKESPRKFGLSIFLAIALGTMEVLEFMPVAVIICIVLLIIPEKWWPKPKDKK